MTISITIKISGGETFSLEIDTSITVVQLKELCSEKANATPDKQRLIFKGRIIKDDEVLKNLNVEDGNTIHLVRSGVKPQADTSATTASATTTTTTTTTTNTCPVNTGVNSGAVPGAAGNFNMPQYGQMPFSPDLMSQMFQNGGMGAGGVPGMPDLNPQTAAALLNSPVIQEMVQQISSNPELLRSLVESSPILQPMMAQNQMFNQMLSNPELVRTLMRPGMLQAGLQMHQAMQGQVQQQQQQQQVQQSGGMPTNPNDPVFNPFSMPTFPGFNFPAPQVDTRSPEDRFATQLQSLQEMGFSDRDANIEALNAAGGDVSAAISRLLNKP